MPAHLLVFLLIALLFGCGWKTDDDAAGPTPPSRAELTSNNPPDPKFPVVPTQRNQRDPLPDNSLTTTHYIQLGLTAPDRPWMGGEFADIAMIIGKLAEHDATQLPRFQSSTSGQIFARLVSKQNLDFYRNASMPLQQRIQDIIAHTQGLNTVLWRYVTISTQRSGLEGEIVELAGAMMHVSVIMQELTDELLPQLDPTDPTYPTRMQGLERLKNGFAITFAGALQMLEETDRYEIKDLQRLLGHLQATLPEITPHLNEGSQLENLVRIEELIKKSEVKELKPGLETLYAQLNPQ